MNKNFFTERPKINPTIYAYELPEMPSHKGFLKVGYTERDAVTRIREQTHTVGAKFKILLTESSVREDGTAFTDKDVHRILRRRGFSQLNEGEDKNEWFACSTDDVKAAILELKTGITNEENRTQNFPMRPEQAAAVEKTILYFESAKKEGITKSPKFLWNAKMRFGKTFASYQLARQMNFKRILVLTFKPAVESAWREDLVSHIDFEGWQFVSNKNAKNESVNIDEAFSSCDKNHPIVVFGSFQDLLGTNENGGIKAKNEFIHATNWDLVIFDEYHFGAWRENARKLFEAEDEETEFDAETYQAKESGNAYNETFLPITTQYYLFLSGTPFRALNSGEFIEEQIFNWTYSDEQKAKAEWEQRERDCNGAKRSERSEEWSDSGTATAKPARPKINDARPNPYAALPKMVMLTYKVPESINRVALQGEFNEFDLNEFKIAGNIFSGGVPCAVAVGNYKRLGRKANYETRMLCF